MVLKGAKEAKSRDQLILYTAETKHFETIVTCRYIFELFYWWLGSFYEFFYPNVEWLRK